MDSAELVEARAILTVILAYPLEIEFVLNLGLFMDEAETNGKPILAFAEECDQGKVREENQDSVRHIHTPVGELVIVADGLGGYSGGGRASRIVVEGFENYLSTLPRNYLPEAAIHEAAARVNAAILAEARQPDTPHHRMGSTVVLALLVEDSAGIKAIIGHIGDSRAYLLREGRLSRLTSDHSAVQALLERNLITPEEALNHPESSVLTRSLGQKPQVEIEINVFPLLSRDSLLLCSDGLWGYVAEREIEMVVGDPSIAVGNAAKILLNLALAAGGPDNIGIELVRVVAPNVAVEVRHKRRFGFLEVFAAGLLGIAAIGTLGYIGVQRHWLPSSFLKHSSRTQMNLGPFTIAIVEKSGVKAGSVNSDSDLNRMELPVNKQASCKNLALGAKETVIYYEQSSLVIRRLIVLAPELFESRTGYDMRKMDAGVRAQCGTFNAVVILPASQ